MYRNCGATNNMQMQLTSVMLLFLLCNGLCSDIDQGKRALEEDVLRSLLSSKVKQGKHIAPLWQLPLQDVCRLVNSLGESWGSEEEQEDTEVRADYEQRVSGTLAQMLKEMHNLQNFCRVLQPREVRIDTGMETVNN
ncbi:neurotensin/neuromedin N [Pimephales promelas]|nr:neurotensin/neuromedin N [Pimephales promelas]